MKTNALSKKLQNWPAYGNTSAKVFTIKLLGLKIGNGNTEGYSRVYIDAKERL